MNNLKRYKEITGKEFIGNDYSIEKFQDSKAVSNLIKEIEKLEHYKHLYSEVKKQKDELKKENQQLKKQKDDGVKYIKEHIKYECDETKQEGILFTIDCLKSHAYNFDYCINDLIKQAEQLQSNWNSLREGIEILINSNLYSLSFKEPLKNVLDKMNELESGDSN